jgi:hypothetical protein
MKRVLPIIAAVAAVVAVWPAASGATTFKGVVVARQHGALLVASRSGAVQSVSGRAAIGSRVTVSGGRAEVVGRAHVARVRGVLVRRVGSTMFLSSNRHLVAVHTARVLASAGNGTPQQGDMVSTQVTIQNGGELDEESTDDLGPSNESALQVQAQVAAVGAGTVTLTVGTQTLTVQLPAGLTLPASLVGQTVTLSLSLDDQNDQGDDDSGGGDG